MIKKLITTIITLGCVATSLLAADTNTQPEGVVLNGIDFTNSILMKLPDATSSVKGNIHKARVEFVQANKDAILAEVKKLDATTKSYWAVNVHNFISIPNSTMNSTIRVALTYTIGYALNGKDEVAKYFSKKHFALLNLREYIKYYPEEYDNILNSLKPAVLGNVKFPIGNIVWFAECTKDEVLAKRILTEKLSATTLINIHAGYPFVRKFIDDRRLYDALLELDNPTAEQQKLINRLFQRLYQIKLLGK